MDCLDLQRSVRKFNRGVGMITSPRRKTEKKATRKNRQIADVGRDRKPSLKIAYGLPPDKESRRRVGEKLSNESKLIMDFDRQQGAGEEARLGVSDRPCQSESPQASFWL